MNPRTIVLANALRRQFAASLCMEAPADWLVRFRPPCRTDAHSRYMHGLARDLSKQVPWCGRHLTVEQWKRFATAKLKKDLIVFDCDEFGQPAEDGGMVVLGAHTRDMTTQEINELCGWFEWFGAMHDVQFSASRHTEEMAR